MINWVPFSDLPKINTIGPFDRLKGSKFEDSWSRISPEYYAGQRRGLSIIGINIQIPKMGSADNCKWKDKRRDGWVRKSHPEKERTSLTSMCHQGAKEEEEDSQDGSRIP